MRTAALPWAVILILGSLALLPQRAPVVSATHDPADFALLASFFGWNYTSPPANPLITEFRGVAFMATIRWVDIQHNFAIYPKGTGPNPDTSDFYNPCTPPCLAESAPVDSMNPDTFLTFTPSIPPDDNLGLGIYEYYCELHPGSMHGQIRVFKSPDLNKNGKVDINDIADMAFRFDTKAGQTLYLAADDLDNDGDIDITDIAFAAFYFDRVL